MLDQGFDLDGTEDDDYIDGTGVTDRIDGKGGDDTLVGEGGDDVLTGGTGNDLLIGGAGKDTYVFNRGDGIDAVDDRILGLDNTAETSVLRFGTGIGASDFKLRVGADDSMVFDLGDDQISFRWFDPQNPLTTPLAEVQFADGSGMTYEELLAKGFDFDGTEDFDLINGTAVTDRINGDGGDDVIFGNDGNDVIAGGEGDDQIDAGAGDDVVDGGEGDDLINGGAGNDTLTGGEGADIMQGGAGDDTFIADDGDVILDSSGANHLDLTAFAELNVGNLEVTQYEADGGDLFLNFHVRDAQNVGETPETDGVSVQGAELGTFPSVTLNDGAGGTVTLTPASCSPSSAPAASSFEAPTGPMSSPAPPPAMTSPAATATTFSMGVREATRWTVAPETTRSTAVRAPIRSCLDSIRDTMSSWKTARPA